MLWSVTLSQVLPLAVLHPQELIWIFAILFLLFGASKLPQLARSLGKSIKEFKKASKEITNEIESAGEDDDDYSSKKSGGGGSVNG